MMKSLAILAATLIAAQAAPLEGNISDATQEDECYGKGCDRRLSVSNSTMDDCKGKGCDRRLDNKEIDQILNDQEEEDCTEENPDDCRRRLQSSLKEIYEKTQDWMNFVDKDGDGEVEWIEFRPKFLAIGMEYEDIRDLFDAMNPYYRSSDAKYFFTEDHVFEYVRMQQLQAKADSIVKKQANKRDANDGARRLDNIEGQMEKEEREDCTEENPDDCRRRLQSSAFDRVRTWISLLDADGDGKLSIEEWDYVQDYVTGGTYVDGVMEQSDTNRDYFLDERELLEFDWTRQSYANTYKALKKIEKQKNDGARRLDDFDEDQLNDGMH